MMARLIDGSLLEDCCKRQMSDEWNKKAVPYSWADAYELFLIDVENCPIVSDGVEVVRCKDCKHRYCYDEANEAPVCTASMKYAAISDDWFCADGERKE